MTKCLIFDLDGTLIKLPIRYEILQKNLQNFFHTENNLSPLIPSIINEAKNNQNVIDDAFKIVCDEELIATESLEEIERLCDNFIDLGVEKIRLTGGEPLVRKDIIHLIKNLNKKKFYKKLKEITLTKNETLLKKYAKE